MHNAFTEKALSLATSSKAKKAFDLSGEPAKLRDAYGRNNVGQSMLLARRLVEAGVRFVTIQGYKDTAFMRGIITGAFFLTWINSCRFMTAPIPRS